MATDPVCGMFVEERAAELKLVRDNRTYYFCSEHCLEEFSHPERALRALRRKLAVAWPLSLIIVLLTYALKFPGETWAAAGLATIVQGYPGLQFYTSTRDAIRSRIWNMDVLIAVGTTAAYGYSLAVLLLPGRLPSAVYFDASSLIVTLILTGNYLEHLTREHARGAVRKLSELLPRTASVVREGREIEIPVGDVRPGDRFRVFPGGRFPADGTVAEGHSSANEALLTGEALPVEKGPGAPVIAGATNGEGALVVVATQVGTDTLLAQIGRLLAEAETSRVPLQQLADRIAAGFVPVVIVLATVASLGWFVLGAGTTVAVLVFVSVVIIACPCAFGIATPAAIVVGTGRAAEEGILFKGRDSLERASEVDVVLTDKTGTLTRGRPSLTDVIPAPGIDPDDLLVAAAAVETGSEHPFSRAVVSAALASHRPIPRAEGVRTDPGRGVQGVVGGVPVAVLSYRAASDGGADLSSLHDAAAGLDQLGRAGSVVLRDGRPIGLLGFSDEVAPGVTEGVRALRDLGISVVMVTGDRKAAAQAVAQAVGIDEVRTEMSPKAKLDAIHEFQGRGKKVAFVGDGVNDAPALAAADLGIAVGAGTDVAREAGGVILIRSDLRGVAAALQIGRRTVRKVRGNLTWALGYNAVLLPVAMGALVPLFGLRVYDLLPIAGALAMGLSSTWVVLNSLSLRWVSVGPKPSRAAARAISSR